MKKFLTLFMASAMVLSVFAVPQNKKTLGAEMLPASQQQEMAQMAQAKAKQIAQTKLLQRDVKRQAVADNIVSSALTGKRLVAAEATDTVTMHFDSFYNRQNEKSAFAK